ncbi:TPA: hypothetical protein ACOTG0_000937 [Clostridium perfringens]
MGLEDIEVRKNKILILLDGMSLSHEKVKDKVIEFLEKNNFNCEDTGKHISVEPIIKIYGQYFKITLRNCIVGRVIPIQTTVLTLIDKK